MPLSDAQHSSAACGWMRTCSHRPQKEPPLRSVGRRTTARRCQNSRPCCPTRRHAGQGYSAPPGMAIPAARRLRSHPGSPCGTGREPRCCRSDEGWFATPTKSAIRKPVSVPTLPSNPPTSSPCTSADARSRSRSPKRALIWASRHSANGPTKLSLEPRQHFSASTVSSRCGPVIFSPAQARLTPPRGIKKPARHSATPSAPFDFSSGSATLIHTLRRTENRR